MGTLPLRDELEGSVRMMSFCSPAPGAGRRRVGMRRVVRLWRTLAKLKLDESAVLVLIQKGAHATTKPGRAGLRTIPTPKRRHCRQRPTAEFWNPDCVDGSSFRLAEPADRRRSKSQTRPEIQRIEFSQFQRPLRRGHRSRGWRQ